MEVNLVPPEPPAPQVHITLTLEEAYSLRAILFTTANHPKVMRSFEKVTRICPTEVLSDRELAEAQALPSRLGAKLYQLLLDAGAIKLETVW